MLTSFKTMYKYIICTIADKLFLNVVCNSWNQPNILTINKSVLEKMLTIFMLMTSFTIST